MTNSILIGQAVEKCMRLVDELKQLELESKSPFVLVNDPEHERRMPTCVSTRSDSLSLLSARVHVIQGAWRLSARAAGSSD